MPATAMTRRERMQAIFDGRTPDRPAVKLWNAIPEQVLKHPDYQPVHDAAMALTDLAVPSGTTFNFYAGRHASTAFTHVERGTADPAWNEIVTTCHTPDGPLTSVFLKSTVGKPGYMKEHLLKEPADIRSLLSLTYDPTEVDLSRYHAMNTLVGDRGIVFLSLDHPMYALQRQIGSELFAMWSIEEPDLLLETIRTFADRLRRHVEAILATGVRGIFGWVGPELCIPPLMSPADFERYVFEIDQPLIARLHDAGSRVWVHCHGKMSPVIRRFATMGVDVLNPIEPPPMGDVTLAEAFAMVGDDMALEGNIETHDLMTAPAELLRAKIHESLEAGRGRRLILCPSSGYMEDITPSAGHIRNLLLYIEEAARYADTMRG